MASKRVAAGTETKRELLKAVANELSVDMANALRHSSTADTEVCRFLHGRN
jgi:hypothetical protein